MSSLLRNAISARFIMARPAGVRAFTTSRTMMLKESDRHTPDLPEQNETHKQDSLQKQQDGKGHWKPELASDSEEAVAADKHEGNESPEDLAHKTKGHAEEKHK